MTTYSLSKIGQPNSLLNIVYLLSAKTLTDSRKRRPIIIKTLPPLCHNETNISDTNK